MLVADAPRQGRTDQPAGAAGNRRRRECAKHGAARRHDRQAAGNRWHIDAGADQRAFRIADRLLRHEADTRRLGIVLEFGGRLVLAPELRGDGLLMREHVDIAMIESGHQQVVDGSLKRCNVVKNGYGFRVGR
ncbi:MAG: hypothetical protein ACRECM_06150 [Methyloceanibacter sp.]